MLLLLLQGRESPGWHGNKHSPLHSTGSLGKMCGCAENVKFALFKLLHENDSECRESSGNCAQICAQVAWQELPWHRWHVLGPMPGHPPVLPGKITGSQAAGITWLQHCF